MTDALVCRTTSRRAEVIAQGLNGLDGIDVLEGQTRLRVHLLASPPAAVTSANVRIDGGRSITNIRVQSVQATRGVDDADPCLLVTVDRPGDFSTYVLRVVDLPGFDARFSALGFSFKVDCRVDTDCAPQDDCLPPDYPRPDLSYLAKDYESLRTLLLERMSVVLPEWRERHVPDLQMSLVELLAYAGDELSMYQDAVATEAYLETARRRISVRRHARLVDYVVHAGCNARAWVCVEVSGELTAPAADVAFLAAAGTIGAPSAVVPCEVLDDVPDGAAVIFEPVDRRDLRFREELNGIELWTWGDEECCLEVGATSATLRGQPELHAGDVLILEEVKGPRTGAAADADPSHRQAVRLTAVSKDTDPLYEQPILTVSWGSEDALRFPLCLSAAVGEDCHPVDDLALARGNVVLVDHGATVGWCAGEDEPLDEPIADPRNPVCDGPCEPVDLPPVARRYEPRPRRSPVTQSAPFPAPEVRAARQWELLVTLPDDARAVLDRVLAAVEDGSAPADDDIAILQGLLGAAVLADAGLPDHPNVDEVRVLSARFAHLLAPVESRLRMILRRRLAGRPLTALVVEELAERWGALVDADALSGPETDGPAATALAQDPRAALPALVLTSTPPDTEEPVTWTTRPDLLESEPDAPDVVGELDDDGTLVLRFGAATGLGRGPLPGEAISAHYRVGNGRAGNVPAEAISRIVLRRTHTESIGRVRNPLPADGGVDPEPLADAKALAPGAARRDQRRAVTADDYASLAAKVPGVQAATARLRWTGGWYEASVGIDAAGAEVAPAALLAAVEARLEADRRLGHDLVVRSADLVPVELALTVCLGEHTSRAQLRAELLDLLSGRSLPGGRRGLFHPDELTPGEPIRISVIVAAVQALPGVETVAVTELRRLGTTVGEQVPSSGILALGPLEIALLANDPSQPDRGRVLLDLQGGR